MTYPPPPPPDFTPSGPQDGPPPSQQPPQEPSQEKPPTWSYAAPPAPPSGSGENDTTQSGEPPVVVLGQGEPPRESPRRWKLAASVTALVVAAAAVGIYVATSGSSSSSGASSPEAAVREASAAVTSQNADKLISLMNPSEVKTLGSLLSLARGKLSNSGVVAAAGTLEPWLTLNLSGLELHVQKVSSQFAFVTVSGGEGSAVVNESQIPAAIRPGNPHQVSRTASLTEGTTLDNGTPAAIATIKIGGGWFLSPTTTAMEDARRANGLQMPNFDSQSLQTNGGGDSPQSALSGFADAAATGDYRTAASYVSSKELPALAYYYPVLGQQLEDDLPGLGHIHVSNLVTDVQSMSNGLKKVVINGASAEGDQFDGTFSYRDGCVSNPDASQKCLPQRFAALSGVTNAFVVVEPDHGKWQISPVGTALEYLRLVFASGNMDAVYLYLRVPELSPVAATVATGGSATVKLNAAGYAHVDIAGAPGSCVPYPSQDDVYLYAVGPEADRSYSGDSTSTCDGGVVPPSGTYDGILISNSTFSAPVTIDLSQH